MFRFFTALARLTTAITRSAELFESANVHLETQLGLDHAEPEQVEHEPANGRRKKTTVDR